MDNQSDRDGQTMMQPENPADDVLAALDYLSDNWPWPSDEVQLTRCADGRAMSRYLIGEHGERSYRHVRTGPTKAKWIST